MPCREAAASPPGLSMGTAEELTEGEHSPRAFQTEDNIYSSFSESCLEGTLLKHIVRDEEKYIAAACLEDLFSVHIVVHIWCIVRGLFFSSWHAAA